VPQLRNPAKKNKKSGPVASRGVAKRSEIRSRRSEVGGQQRRIARARGVRVPEAGCTRRQREHVKCNGAAGASPAAAGLTLQTGAHPHAQGQGASDVARARGARVPESAARGRVECGGKSARHRFGLRPGKPAWSPSLGSAQSLRNLISGGMGQPRSCFLTSDF